MKSYVKLCQIVVLIIFVWGIASFFNTIFHSISAIRYITFSFDPQLSPITCNAIQKHIALFESNGIYNPTAIVEKIPWYFAAIKSIELQQFPQHMALVTITAFDPIVRINDTQLLIENQEVLLSDFYALYKIEALQKIMVASVSNQINATVLAAIKQCITEKIFDRYTFHVVNDHEWYLHDSHDPMFTLCCNASSLPIDFLQITYDRLKEQIKKRGPAKTKWVADVRFHDQIILSMDKGERYA